MEDGCPDSSPDHKSGIQCNVVDLNDIIDGIIEQRDQTSDANNSQRLCAQETEDHCSKSGGEERFIDAIELARTAIHVKNICQRWQDTARWLSGFEISAFRKKVSLTSQSTSVQCWRMSGM